MNKIVSLIFISSLIGSISALSYTIKIRDTTGTQMRVDINYGGPGVCSPDAWRIDPNGSIEKGVGGCCAKPGVKFTAESGDLRGQTFSYDPPRTGFGLSCRSWNARTVRSGNNFIVETE